MKKARLMIIIFALVGLVGVTVMVKTREGWLKGINESISDYYYISSPNGNSLEVKQDGLFCYYELKKYDYSTLEDNGYLKYKAEASIIDKVKFHNTGLLSGDSSNYETDFPRCAIEKNDASDKQLFYHPSVDETKVKSEKSDGGKMYISLKGALSLNETAEIISKLSEYGEVTWLWVDTYAGQDMSEAEIIQNAGFDGKKLNAYGIPLYYGGEKIENAADCFLGRLNSVSSDNDNFCAEVLTSVKRGIKPEGGEITETNIKVIGLVILPSPEIDRAEIFEAICKDENVRAVN